MVRAITSIDVDRNGTAYQDWTLDELGNWDAFDDDGSTETRTHNQSNEIVTTDAGANPTHDAAGNMTFDGTLHYTYDAWIRLVAVHADDSGSPGTPGDLIVTYEFDGQKRRIVETVEGTPDEVYNNYYNANWQLLETRKDGDVDPLKQFIWDLRYIDAPIVRFHDANTDGDYIDAGDDTLYFTTDANFNVTAVIDNTGAVIERYAYDSYGKVMILDADWSEDADGVSDVDNRTLFTGYHYDSETGLYLARNRVYHPTLGRFIQRDPLGYPDGMNTYAGYFAMHGDVDPYGAQLAGYTPIIVAPPYSSWQDVDGRKQEIPNLLPNVVCGLAGEVFRFLFASTDSFGRALFRHWFWGGGTRFQRLNNSEWGRYIMEEDPEEAMSDYITRYFTNLSNKNRDIDHEKYFSEPLNPNEELAVSIGRPGGGFSSGHELLHGANAHVGGLEIKYRGKRALRSDIPSKYTTRLNDSSCVYMYRALVTFNDIFDPNNGEDISMLGGLLVINEGELGSIARKLFGANDYTINISWSMRIVTVEEPNANDSGDVVWLID